MITRVFALDVLDCPFCRGPMRILAAINLSIGHASRRQMFRTAEGSVVPKLTL